MSKPEWKSWEGRLVDGKYTLRQWLGGSDHSAVFLTESPANPGQKSAIKLIAAESGSAADHQLPALRGITKLSHPNLIRAFDAGRFQMNGTPLTYVLMEYAEEDLSQILPQRALEPAEVRDLLPPLINALSYLHSSGLVHGRIKPSNILAVGDQLKLSSDQIAPAAVQDSQHRRRDGYDAPETAAGIVSPAGDVWSLGVTLVAALTQNFSFAEDGSKAGAGLPQNVPEPFRSIARECLHLDPKQRCTLKDVQARLQGERPTAPAEPKQAPLPVTQPSNRRPAFPVTIAIAVVLAVIFAIFYFRGSKSENSNTTQQPTEATPPAAAPVTPQNPAPAPHSSAGGIVHQSLPDIPRSAMNTISGTIKVVVRAQVDSSGRVTSSSFKSSGSSHYFAQHALQAAQRWEFSPPVVNGQPAASTWLIQFRFRRSGTQASAQRVNH
ncbi:MAG TPA: TonB family protein [Candidatus Sulfotelmatobacter sp.]|nr:TonB family protein [Candidatus Sulfotelmatobacter sp.]